MVKERLRKYSLNRKRIYVTFESGEGLPGIPVVKESNNKKEYFFKYENSGELVPICVSGKNRVRFDKNGFLKLPNELSSYFE